VLDLKGGSARGEVGPARLAAHRSRSTCDAEVARCHRRPARVDICSPCRRCARCAPGVPGCRDGPLSVVERPNVLDIRQRDPRVHRRPRGCALYSRTAWLVPSGRRRPAFRARRHRAAVAPKALTASLLKPSGTDLFEDPFRQSGREISSPARSRHAVSRLVHGACTITPTHWSSSCVKNELGRDGCAGASSATDVAGRFGLKDANL